MLQTSSTVALFQQASTDPRCPFQSPPLGLLFVGFVSFLFYFLAILICSGYTIYRIDNVSVHLDYDTFCYTFFHELWGLVVHFAHGKGGDRLALAFFFFFLTCIGLQSSFPYFPFISYFSCLDIGFL